MAAKGTRTPHLDTGAYNLRPRGPDSQTLAEMRTLLQQTQTVALERTGGNQLSNAYNKTVQVYNENLGVMGAAYVLKLCIDLLSLGDNQVPDDLRNHVLTLQLELRKAAEAEEWTVNKRDAEDLEKMKVRSRQAVCNQYRKMIDVVKRVVKNFVPDNLDWTKTRAELKRLTHTQIKWRGKTTQKSNDLAGNKYVVAVALSAFLSAIHTYLNKHFTKTSLKWTE